MWVTALYSNKIIQNDNMEVLVESIKCSTKDKLIQHIEDNGLPVINIFKCQVALKEDLPCEETKQCSTPRFQEAGDISKISYKEVK